MWGIRCTAAREGCAEDPDSVGTALGSGRADKKGESAQEDRGGGDGVYGEQIGGVFGGGDGGKD